MEWHAYASVDFLLVDFKVNFSKTKVDFSNIKVENMDWHVYAFVNIRYVSNIQLPEHWTIFN